MTPKQERFAQEYIANGGNDPLAAVRHYLSQSIGVESVLSQIVVKQAYILERVFNRAFDQTEFEDEPNIDRIEETFREIRGLLNDLLEEMGKKP